MVSILNSICVMKKFEDNSTIKPGILHLNKGTVIQKAHWNDIEDILL